MAIILNIETATSICSIALSKDGDMIQRQISDAQNNHSEVLTVFIETVMQQAKMDFRKLDAIAVSEGPGSYTGLRIGASVAKGLCYSLNKPLIGISTLQAMAQGMKNLYVDKDAYYCPMIDARRMEVYTALFDYSGNMIQNISAKVIDDKSFLQVLSQRKVVFGGDGMKKCIGIINTHNAIFLDHFLHTSEGMIALSEIKWQTKQFVNIAYFEPFYLKEFQPGKKSSMV